MTSSVSSLLLVGCGKMGGALLQRWQKNFADTKFHVIDPNHVAVSDASITWYTHIDSLPAELAPSVIVFAVKPQELEHSLPPYRARYEKSAPLYLSIAAGKPIAFYTRHLGEHAHIVRAMPNTPALIGKGITALCAAPTLSAANQKIAGDLMSAVGKIEWLSDESLMDAVTAISGCGPAYVFLFLQSLVEAGMACGLPETLAKSLAVQTVHGSLHLTEHTGKSLEELRTEVASPGGATQAALDILMQNNSLKDLLERAVTTAKNRSGELSK